MIVNFVIKKQVKRVIYRRDIHAFCTGWSRDLSSDERKPEETI